MKTVLVVDDSKTIRTAVAWTLRGPEIDVQEASSEADAYARLQEKRPDLVILDAQLGEADGFELCRRLKADWPGRLSVILMGSAHQAFDGARAAAAGADGHVLKPFDTKSLVELVRGNLGLPAVDDAPLTYAGRLAQERAMSSVTSGNRPPPPPSDSHPEGFGPNGGRPSVRSGASVEVRIEEEEPFEVAPEDVIVLERPRTIERADSETGLMPGPVLEPPAPPHRSPSLNADVWALAEGRPVEGPPNPFTAGEPAHPPQAQSPPSPASPATTKAVRQVSAAAAQAVSQAASVPGLDKAELLSLAREVLEEVAWEVVPDLAESIIREELARLTERSD